MDLLKSAIGPLSDSNIGLISHLQEWGSGDSHAAAPPGDLPSVHMLGAVASGDDTELSISDSWWEDHKYPIYRGPVTNNKAQMTWRTWGIPFMISAQAISSGLTAGTDGFTFGDRIKWATVYGRVYLKSTWTPPRYRIHYQYRTAEKPSISGVADMVRREFAPVKPHQ